MTHKDACTLLAASQMLFDEDDERPAMTINLNDQFCWACADAETIPDDQVVAVANLFRTYGWGGILYWVSERRGGMRSEFADINRTIEFVRQEQAIVAEEPNDSARAYLKRSYVIGAEQ